MTRPVTAEHVGRRVRVRPGSPEAGEIGELLSAAWDQEEGCMDCRVKFPDAEYYFRGAELELADVGEPAKHYLIWATDHDAWWAPGRYGYVRTVAAAGRYTADEVAEILVNDILREQRIVRESDASDSAWPAVARVATREL